MLEYMSWILLFIWVAVLIGFITREVWILMFSGLIMMVVGIYMLTNGLEDTFNLAVTAFSFLHIGFGFYILMKSAGEVWKK